LAVKPPQNPSAKALLEEVKQQYNNEFARKGTLETKANNMITIAGTIATLLFGFGTFLIDKLGSKYGLILPISLALAVGIVLIIISMIFSIWVSRIQRYKYVITPLYFYSAEGFNEAKINRFIHFQEEEFCSVMIKNYLRCNERNFRINSSNAKTLKYSQICFLFGLISIPVIVFILLITLTNIAGTALPVNQNVTLTVYTNGHAIDLKATLAARPSLHPFLTTRSTQTSMPPPLIP
jgi:hypothetical protein